MVGRCLLVLGFAGCSSLLGIQELEGPPDGNQPPPGDTNPNLTPCGAQRVVHIVGGDGGLAWFTQIWPVPANVTAFSNTVAFDDPNQVVDITVEGTHPLYSRAVGLTPLWSGRGRAPQPSVFLAGVNETHTATPSSSITNGVNSLVAAAATIQQTELTPPVVVLILVNSGPYGSAQNAPAPMMATDVDAAISNLQITGTITPAQADTLRPSASQLANYVGPGAIASVNDLANRLAFTANGFRMGLFGSVILPAFNDDPHTAFANRPAVTVRANQLRKILDQFYFDLGPVNETCGDESGNFLSVADNTVMIVTGDTYKNPFITSDWQDGTPQNTNLMYLRSNGFTKPGWFGALTTTATNFFDPATGVVSVGAVQSQDTAAAFGGALYSIARGNRMAVSQFTSAEFDGTIVPTMP